MTDNLAHLRGLNFAAPFRSVADQPLGNDQVQPGRERLELVTKGRGWVQHDDGWIEVTAGSLVWNVAGDWTIGRSDFADPFQCLAFDFFVRPQKRRVAPRFSRWDDPAEVAGFAQRIGRMVAQPQTDKRVVGVFIYAQLLIQAQQWERSDRHRPLAPQMRRMVAIIDGRYAEPLDVAALATATGWSPSHMHASFRKYFSTSPHQYLLRRRLQAVCEALLRRNHGLADIALTTGFASAQALIRAFRRQHGITPMQWRERNLSRGRG